MANENTRSTAFKRHKEKQLSQFIAISKQVERMLKGFEEDPLDEKITGMLNEFHAFLCNYWTTLLGTGDGAGLDFSDDMLRRSLHLRWIL